MDVRNANLIPRRATTPEIARALVARDGAALVDGVESLDAAIDFGERMLGDRAVRVRPQFEATKEHQERENAIVMAQGPDERGRRRTRVPMDGHQPAHNDGFAFGDFAPDHMFLWCERPCAIGGASFLVDALELLAIVGADDPEFAAFAWSTPVDHSEPNFPQGSYAPIARIVRGGRAQVRSQPHLSSVPGPDEARHDEMLARWSAAVDGARTSGPQFRAVAGQMLCIDNYRMLHGRNGYVDEFRKMVSIWAWTTDAVAVPDGPLSIAEPDLEALRAAV